MVWRGVCGRHRVTTETQGFFGRVVVITGASRGLGQVLAQQFSAAGASVGLIARDGVAVKQLAATLPGRAAAVACDVSDEDEVAAAFAHIADTLDGVDTVVANAGIAAESGRGHKLSLDSWRAILDVNLTGSFLTARAAYPYLAASKQGRLVLTSSVMARLPRRGIAAYAASKAGIEGLTRALAVDWARDGISVNAVAPGFFGAGLGTAFAASDRLAEEVSSRIPLDRFGAPEELARTVRFLVSPASGYVTGQVIAVDGGYGLG